MNILGRGNSSVVLRPTPLGTYVPKTPLVGMAIMEAELPPSLPSAQRKQTAGVAAKAVGRNDIIARGFFKI